MMQFDRIQDSSDPTAVPPESFRGSTARITPVNGGPQDGWKKKKLTLRVPHLIAVLLLFLLLLLLAIILTALLSRGSGRAVAEKAVENGTGSLDKAPEPKAVQNGTGSLDKAPEAKEPKVVNEVRLPNTWWPLVYNLTIRVYLPAAQYKFPSERNFSIDGDLRIQMQCKEATNVVFLNQKDIEFTDSSVAIARDTEDKKWHAASSVTKNDETTQVEFTFPERCTVGANYTLKLKYQAPINGDVLNGMYRSKYQENGETKWLAVTQMEPVDGRKMVPMFDEPQMKAHFNLTVIHPAGTTAIGNGKEILDKVPIPEEPDWVKTQFESSPKMSSYLLAVCICEFKYKEGHTKDGIRFRIWARPDMLDKTDYALKTGIAALNMIALPDFEAGAMENWGLITYRESNLLYDEHTYSLSNKQRVAVVIAHELAHQWFGNLVTMKWWEDLWLNEGFASYMEYIGTDAVSNGSFHMEDQFVVESLQNAMNRDHLSTSHPLFVPIQRVADLSSVFDAISYDKGASVLHMVDEVIGTENFKKGLSYYLHTFSFGNAENKDLWISLTKKLKGSDVKDWNGDPMDVTKFMNSWTLQMGYPVVSVQRNADTGDVYVSQERFKLDPKSEENKRYEHPPYNYTWNIPLWYITGDNSKNNQLKWLTTKGKNKLLTLAKKDDLLVLNSNSAGYYRVLYDDQGYDLIVKQLEANPNVIPAKTRAQLLDDVFTLARGGRVEFERALKMTAYLKTESNALGWDVALGNLHLINTYFKYEPAYGAYKKYMASLVNPLYNSSFWENKHTEVLQQRFETTLVGESCYFGNEECRERGIKEFKKVMTNCVGKPLSDHTCNSIPANLRGRVYCLGVEHGTEKDWSDLWQKYLTEPHQLEKKRLIYGVTCASRPHLINTLLDEVVRGTNVRSQDVSYFMLYLSRSTYGAPLVWSYFQQNFERLYAKYGESKYSFRYIIRAAVPSSLFTNDFMVGQLEQMREKHTELATFTEYDIALEKAKTNANWMKKNYEKLSKYFENIPHSAR